MVGIFPVNWVDDNVPLHTTNNQCLTRSTTIYSGREALITIGTEEFEPIEFTNLAEIYLVPKAFSCLRFYGNPFLCGAKRC